MSSVVKHLPTFDGVGPDGATLNGRPYISASSALMYIECGHKWFLRYVRKIKPQKSWKTEFGIVWHSTVEDALNHYRDHGAHFTLDEMYERFKHHLDERILKTGLTRDLIRDFGNLDFAIEGLRDEGHKLVRLFLTHPEGAKGLQPSHVEYEIRWMIHPDFDVKMKLDVVESWARTRIKDFKTTSYNNVLDASARAWFAGTVYAGGWHAETGDLPESMKLIRVNRRSREPFIDTAEAERTLDDVAAAKALLLTVVNLIQQDVFPPDGIGKVSSIGVPACRLCEYAPQCGPRRAALAAIRAV